MMLFQAYEGGKLTTGRKASCPLLGITPEGSVEDNSLSRNFALSQSAPQSQAADHADQPQRRQRPRLG
ncbi:MAG: hypothetical protein N3E46_12690, partial [Gemmataceae bacterium]|nr:hypothetical protein [Gemmataceae bacterium]